MPQKYPTRTGLVAFFDVLGYQDFVLHSDIQKSAEVIEKVVLPMPSIALHLIVERLKLANSEELKRCLGKPVIISDSIVWDFSFDPSLRGGVEIQWITFLTACSLFQQLMFKQWLPVRGAISYGEYYISGSCFAGKPVIEAYALCSKINLVGCGMTLRAEKELPRGKVGGIDAFAGLLTDYLTPLNGLPAQYMKLLNWGFPGGFLLEPLGDDIRDKIVESFLGHGKQIPIETYAKVNNTEAFLRHCQGAKKEWDRLNPPPDKRAG